MGVEMEDAMVRNNLRFANNAVIPERLHFQGVDLQAAQAHVQGQLIQVARQATNPLMTDSLIPNQSDQLKDPTPSNGYSW